MENVIKIVFFSGTGGTARVADIFEKSLKARGNSVIKHEINKRNLVTTDNEDMLIIIYSVHACNAPKPVYEYIESVAKVENIPTAVISVSGGGEITPNTASRLHCIKRLEKKGYEVFYENMIVMPSNFIVSTIDELAIRLIEILPFKVEKIIDDLLSGVRRRTNPNVLNRFLAAIGEFNKDYTKSFGRKIEVNNNCIGCGWCEKSCPMGNIILKNGRPNFENECVACLRCIYGCPQKALTPGTAKYIIVKEGFNLDSIEKRVGEVKTHSIDELAKGYLWKGIKDYLLEDINKQV